MIIALIQARMGSTRLPGKVLADIEGMPMLWHVVARVNRASQIDRVAVVTSTESSDNAVAEFCRDYRIECFRGSEKDVLDRCYQAAKYFKADTIVRITGDCPLIDPEVIDEILKTYSEGDYDYVSNALRYTFPDGLDVEVFSFEALETAWKESDRPADREHVTSYLRTSGRFRIHNLENARHPLNHYLRWTVDEPADLDFVRSVYKRLGTEGRHFGFSTILKLLSEEPSLGALNAGITCNEGYYKSLAKEPALSPRTNLLAKSMEFLARAEKVIPSCTQTFSKGPTQFVQGAAPNFLERAEGSHLWDVDGNEYIDYPMALGPVILGHNYPAVTNAVIEQIKRGTTFSLPHYLEVELAEVFTEIIPCAEMVRFGKNGSDVTAGAVRLARAYTGRDIIACCGYHGWQDWYIGTTTRNRGVPKAVQELTIPFAYNDISSLEKIFAEHPSGVAAVIMEPIGVTEPQSDFLEKVSDVTRRNGALLIFDEIVTGFRLALGGAQEYFGVIPDLACFGKGMANGYPLSAVCGRRELMKLFDEIFFSFTFGGEAVSLAAAVATIREMREKKVMDHLWHQGSKLKDGYAVLSKIFGIETHTRCIGLPPRTLISFFDESGSESLLYKSLFQQECLKRGILFSGGQNICFSHSDGDIDYTLRVYRSALEILAEAIQAGDVAKRLDGQPVQPVFRKA